MSITAGRGVVLGDSDSPTAGDLREVGEVNDSHVVTFPVSEPQER